MKKLISSIGQIILALGLIFCAILAWYFIKENNHGYNSPETVATHLFNAWNQKNIYEINMCIDTKMNDYDQLIEEISDKIELDEADLGKHKTTIKTKSTGSKSNIEAAEKETGFNNIQDTATVTITTERPVIINNISYDYKSVSEINTYKRNNRWFILSFDIGEETPDGRTDRSQTMILISGDGIGKIYIPDDYVQKPCNRPMITKGATVTSPDNTVQISMMSLPNNISYDNATNYIKDTISRNGITPAISYGTNDAGIDYTKLLFIQNEDTCIIETVYKTTPVKCLELMCPIPDTQWHEENCIVSYSP